jgi:two-component system KDP operon response regulator KdpE
MVSPDTKLILVVDDESRMVRFVRMNLELEGYQVSEASNGMEALEKVRDELPDLVVLDVMMPEIMLTVKGDEEDRIRGLELGADDYVTKPFSPRELASRIRAVLRRAEMPSPVAKTTIRIDDRLEIDFRQREVIVDGEQIRLRPTEYRLLYHLVNNAGWVMTHEMLLSKVWGYEYREETGLLRLYITYLRKKIEADPGNPRYIFTERGVGYRFVDFGKDE